MICDDILSLTVISQIPMMIKNYFPLYLFFHSAVHTLHSTRVRKLWLCKLVFEIALKTFFGLVWLCKWPIVNYLQISIAGYLPTQQYLKCRC